MQLTVLHKKRLLAIGAMIFGIMLSVALILVALRSNINAFYTPSELNQAQLSPQKQIRLGGLVKKGTIVHAQNKTLGLEFILTDLDSEIVVEYEGLVPDLFREGQGVIADGLIQSNGTFKATRLLAKHDENYMPKQVKETIDRSLTASTKL